MCIKSTMTSRKTTNQTPIYCHKESHPEDLVTTDNFKVNYANIGWSLGNTCILKCKQCYSRNTRIAGANLNKDLIKRIIQEIVAIGAKTVNLGGNEPVYTNGLDVRKSLLPYILEQLTKNGLIVGVTTAGPTLIALEKYFPGHVQLINDVDISLDSPFEKEHDANRGVNGVYKMAIKTMEICEKYHIPKSIIMCGMNWNFNSRRINAMVDLAIKHNANFRVNPMKPTEPQHMSLILTPEKFYSGLEIILKRCRPIDLSDPAWATYGIISPEIVSGCPCGTSSFRIHSITPDGKIPVSPCVYLHDYKYGDLAKMSLGKITNSAPFKTFQLRKSNPEKIKGCDNCQYIDVCAGGCASRSYLHNLYLNSGKNRSLFIKDPYCPKQYLKNKRSPLKTSIVQSKHTLVHQGYLCTGIFAPIK